MTKFYTVIGDHNQFKARIKKKQSNKQQHCITVERKKNKMKWVSSFMLIATFTDDFGYSNCANQGREQKNHL